MAIESSSLGPLGDLSMVVLCSPPAFTVRELSVTRLALIFQNCGLDIHVDPNVPLSFLSIVPSTDLANMAERVRVAFRTPGASPLTTYLQTQLGELAPLYNNVAWIQDGVVVLVENGVAVDTSGPDFGDCYQVPVGRSMFVFSTRAEAEVAAAQYGSVVNFYRLPLCRRSDSVPTAVPPC